MFASARSLSSFSPSLSALLYLGATLSPFLRLASASGSQRFALQEKHEGWDFISGFTWETANDPTHGRVNYLDQATSMEKNLTYASANKFVMRADSKNIVSPNARGRDSNRISSHSVYTDSVLVLDLTHMPEGSSTWPAFWTVTRGAWPKGGEIDVIEGVNTQENNLASLHTTDGCVQAQNREQRGTTQSTNCNANENGNQGCGTQFSSPLSYGTGFNNAGGGYYAMVRTATKGVQVFFWSRGDPTTPQAVRNGAGEVIVDSTWGVPEAEFGTESCDFPSHFDAHQIVFDLTFCGDWAGNTYPGGYKNCEDYVDNHPEAFANAYWEIDSLRIYTPA